MKSAAALLLTLAICNVSAAQTWVPAAPARFVVRCSGSPFDTLNTPTPANRLQAFGTWSGGWSFVGTVEVGFKGAPGNQYVMRVSLNTISRLNPGYRFPRIPSTTPDLSLRVSPPFSTEQGPERFRDGSVVGMLTKKPTYVDYVGSRIVWESAPFTGNFAAPRTCRMVETVDADPAVWSGTTMSVTP